MSKTIVTKSFAYKCPHCGEELSLNRDCNSEEIERLGSEISIIDSQLCANKEHWEEHFSTKHDYFAWKHKAIMARSYKVARIEELKAQRQGLYNLHNAEIDVVFRKKVKELLGEEEYTRLRQESEIETLTSYKVEVVEEE